MHFGPGLGDGLLCCVFLPTDDAAISSRQKNDSRFLPALRISADLS